MSEINPFSPNESESAESNVFLNLNQKDKDTGVPIAGPNPTQAPESKRFNGQVALAAFVFTIGVGSIYAMRYIGMKAGISESVKMVEYTASTTSPDFVKRFESVMSELDAVELAVQFDQESVLPLTPFTLENQEEEEFEDIILSDDPVQDELARQERAERQRLERERMARETRMQEIEMFAGDLKLQSVIGGSRPVARISGKPAAIGTELDGGLVVSAITGSSVIVEAEGIRYELRIGEPATKLD